MAVSSYVPADLLEGSAGSKRKDRELGGAAEPGRYLRRAHPSGHIEGRQGVVIPALEKPAGSDRLDRREKRNPDLAAVRVPGEHQGRRRLSAWGYVVYDARSVHQPDLGRAPYDTLSRLCELRRPGDRVVQTHQSQGHSPYVNGLRLVDQELDAGGPVGIDRGLTHGTDPIFPVSQQGDSGKAAAGFGGKVPDVTHRSQRLSHVAGKKDDVRKLLMNQVESGARRDPVSREVHIGDLGDPKAIQPGRQPVDADLVTGQKYPVGLETECIDSDCCAGGADAG